MWSAGHHKILPPKIPIFSRFQISRILLPVIFLVPVAEKNIFLKNSFTLIQATYQKTKKIWISQYWSLPDSYRTLALKYVQFWIFQDCQYVKVLNFQGYTGFTYFCKYDRIIEMQLWKGSEYSKIPNMLCFCIHKVLNMPEYGWIMLG